MSPELYGMNAALGISEKINYESFTGELLDLMLLL